MPPRDEDLAHLRAENDRLAHQVERLVRERREEGPRPRGHGIDCPCQACLPQTLAMECRSYVMAWRDGAEDALDAISEPEVLTKVGCVARIERMISTPGTPPVASRDRPQATVTDWDKVGAALGLDMFHSTEDVLLEIEQLHRGSVPQHDEEELAALRRVAEAAEVFWSAVENVPPEAIEADDALEVALDAIDAWRRTAKASTEARPFSVGAIVVLARNDLWPSMPKDTAAVIVGYTDDGAVKLTIPGWGEGFVTSVENVLSPRVTTGTDGFHLSVSGAKVPEEYVECGAPQPHPGPACLREKGHLGVHQSCSDDNVLMTWLPMANPKGGGT